MPYRRLYLLLAYVLALLAAPALPAEPITIGRTACYAVTDRTVADSEVARLRFACSGMPAGYQSRSLWLSADPALIVRQGDGFAVLVHYTRFDKLTVLYVYSDGHVSSQSVRRGDYGDRWRVGAQIVFVAPAGAVVPARVVLRFDHLTSASLLRARVMPVSLAGRDLALASALIGGALILLLAGAIYHFSLAVAVKRQYLAWHGAWAMSVFLWGMLWSQMALIFAPGVAGTMASQISTFLACTAEGVATASVLSAIDRAVLPKLLRRATLALGIVNFMLGLPAALATGGTIEILSPWMSLTMVANLIGVAGCIAIGWRRGSLEARDLGLAWSVPMLTLAITEFVDLGEALFGGGSQIAVLFACALQTVWLAVAVTLRLARLRLERDAALAAESAMVEIASRDSMTGLLNRRGFIDRTRAMFADQTESGAGLALLLIDVDHFKSINDGFGHEAGDEVLCTIAARLKHWERALCLAGRLGGEEFVIAVSGFNAFALGQFADQLRIDLGACDHGIVSHQRRVTVSIGVALAYTATSFERLYGMADRALYEAKHDGRDRVCFAGLDEPWKDMFGRRQFAFKWRDDA